MTAPGPDLVRAVRAACLTVYSECTFPSKACERHCAGFVNPIRAALAELAEPSEAMLDAGYDASHPVDGAIAYAVVDAIWRAIMGNVLGDEP